MNMKTEHTFWTDRLSEALDGTLPPAQAEALDEHLAACPACRAVRSDLSEVRRRARALESVDPERDLWLDIAPRLHTAGEEDKVIPMHGTPPRGVRDRPRVRMSAPQAVAAGLVLALGGGLAGAWVGAGEPAPPPSVSAAEPASAALVAAGEALPPGLFDELQLLEEALRADVSRLEPETRAVILGNLAIIDRAIRESVQALEEDPESRYLQGHLGSALQRKVGYLQQVTRFMES